MNMASRDPAELVQLVWQHLTVVRNDVTIWLHAIPTTRFTIAVLSICIPPLLALLAFELQAARTRSRRPKGCIQLGVKRSNISNEFDKESYRVRPLGTDQGLEKRGTVRSLWIYPVKSCKGIEVEETTVLHTGLEYDRMFTFAMLKSPGVDEKNDSRHWQFITQRQYPLLATVKTELWIPDPRRAGHGPSIDAHQNGVLIIRFPRTGAIWLRGLTALASWIGVLPEREFQVPFNPTEEQIARAGYPYEKITVWKDTVEALNMGTEVPTELQHYLRLDKELALFRADDRMLREVYRCAPKKEELGWQPVIGFPDAYPLHLINIASVRDFEGKLLSKEGIPRLPVGRFRPNIIVAGPDAYEEDTWKQIRISDCDLAVSCRTTRCKLPNVDQQTGLKHPVEPDRTLRKLRSVDPGAGNNMGCLGVQMVPVKRESSIQVGDEVTVLQTGEHFYIK